MDRENRLISARYKAGRYRDMLPTFAEANDKMGFTRDDLDVLLYETADMAPMSANDLRHGLIVQLRVYHRSYMAALGGTRGKHSDRIDEIVADITKGWDTLRIHAPPVIMRHHQAKDPGKG